MKSDSMKSEDHQGYVKLSDEAIEYLPEKWRKYLLEITEAAHGVLETADENLRILNRLVHAFPTMASLRYIQHRLASTKFEATTEWMFENDMLTLAFVTTYVRLIDGGIGSGVSRSALPAELRPVHDKIVELRNKRYAHNAGHESLNASLNITFEGGSFEIDVDFYMDTQVGGALKWEPLVVFLDSLMFDRLQTQLERLKAKTGREWTFPNGPPPNWVYSGLDCSFPAENGGTD